MIQNDDIRWSKPFNKASSVFFSRRCFELRGDDIGHPLCIAGCRQPQHVQQLKLIDRTMENHRFQEEMHLAWLIFHCHVSFREVYFLQAVAVERNVFCNPAEGAYETSEKYNLGAALFTYPSTRDLRETCVMVRIFENRLERTLDLLKLCPQACQIISLLKPVLFALLCASRRVHESMLYSSVLSLRAAALPDLRKQSAQAGSHPLNITRYNEYTRYGLSWGIPSSTHLQTELKIARSPETEFERQTEIPRVSNNVGQWMVMVCRRKNRKQRSRASIPTDAQSNHTRSRLEGPASCSHSGFSHDRSQT